nr:uncharacterized protein LOC108388231 isoform X4 [Manis javanica]
MWTLRSPLTRSRYVDMTSGPGGRKENHQHLWNLLKRNNHVKVQIQLLAWKFQNLLKMGRQKCPQKTHRSTKKKPGKKSQWELLGRWKAPRGKCPGDDGGGRGDIKTQICGCSARCS